MSVDVIDPDLLAREMKSAQDEARQIATFTARHAGFDPGLAYAVADRIHARRLAEGAVAVGRKIGFTNAEMWALFGVQEPIWAHVYDRSVEMVGTGSTACALGGFCEPRIEPEIVVHFADAPPSDGAIDGVLGAIDWIAHGIEVVQSHFPGWRFRAADTIADGALHARLLVGPPLRLSEIGNDALGALERCEVVLSRNGDPQALGRGANALGNPIAAVSHLCRVLAKRGAAPLAAGELVTTGTLTPALPIRPRETWSTRISGLSLAGLGVAFTR